MSDDEAAAANRQIEYDQAVTYGTEAQRLADEALGIHVEDIAANLALGRVPRVYEAINKVQAELATIGIGKDRKNQQQGFMFRGIDDVYNTVSPLLAKHHLCILPRMLSRTVDERQTKSGGVLFYVTVAAEFDFVSSLDASRHVVRTFGEAMDSGDKATNKAMSAAYKYAVMQGFAIPTEGDNDADASTHDEVQAGLLSNALRAISKSANIEVLRSHFETAYLMLPPSQRAQLTAAKDKRKAELEGNYS